MTQNQKEKEKGSDALSVNHRCSMQHPSVWAELREMKLLLTVPEYSH